MHGLCSCWTHPFQGPDVWPRKAFADGHTASNAPDLFRPPKLSGAGPGQYWGGGPRGKTLGCCQLLKPHGVVVAAIVTAGPSRNFLQVVAQELANPRPFKRCVCFALLFGGASGPPWALRALVARGACTGHHPQKRLAQPQQPILYLEPKWLRCCLFLRAVPGGSATFCPPTNCLLLFMAS